ncbi:MAG TPA: hypothetical protein VGM02_08200 [Acidobacteriaceae bacterium]
MAAAVLTVANNMQNTGSWHRRSLAARLADKKILETRNRRDCCGSFQKRTALHNASLRDGMWGRGIA